MKIEPLFGRVIIESVQEEPQQGLLAIPFARLRDRGRVINAGESKTLKNGDYVVYNLRGIRIIKINHKEYMSVDEKDIFAILGE